ncbi:MAG: hypothetical protein ACRC9E_15475 [Plesiomonas shigelloides]
MSGLCVSKDANGYLHVVGEYPLESCQYVVVSAQEYAGLNWFPITPEDTFYCFGFVFAAFISFWVMGVKFGLAKTAIKIM